MHQLAKHGRHEEPRQLAESGDVYARHRHYRWLADQDQLKPINDDAARILAETLAHRGRTAELYDLAAAAMSMRRGRCRP